MYVSRRCLGFALDDVWPNELVVMTRYGVEDMSMIVMMIDKTSADVVKWIGDSSSAVNITNVPSTPIKTKVTHSESVASIHPSKSAADVTIEEKKTTLKYDLELETTQTALKNAIAMNNASPIAIDQIE